MPIPNPIRGIVTPLLTPLRNSNAVDEECFERIIEHVIQGGVSGIFVLGTTGEGPAIDKPTQRTVIDLAVKHIAGRVPLLVGIADASYEESMSIARHAADAGADAVVTTGPLYFAVSQADLYAYCGKVAEESPLPVFLYNIPSCSHVSFAVETVAKASNLGNVAGFKDSSANMIFYHQVRVATAHNPGFAVVMGPEELMAESVLLGGHGGVNGGSNLFPELYVSLYDAATRGDTAEISRLQARVMEISGAVYSPTYLPGIKCAAAALGLCQEVFAAPYYPVDEPRRRAIRDFIDRNR